MQDLIKESSIKTKLWGTVGLLLLIALLILGFSYARINSFKQNATVHNDAGFQRMLIQRMARKTEQLAAGNLPDTSALTADIQQFETTLRALSTRHQGNYPPPTTTVEKKLEAVKNAWLPYKNNLRELLSAAEQNQPLEKNQGLTYIRTHTPRLISRMDAVVDAWAANSRAEIYSTLRYELILIALFLFTGGTGLFFLAQRIVRPLKKMESAVEAIAEGNLNQSVQVNSNDELGKLASRFNQMTEKLQQTMVDYDYLEKILNSVTSMIAVATAEGTIVEVNQFMLNKLGYKETELIEEDLDKICARDCGYECPPQNGGTIKCLQKESMHNVESVLRKKNGDLISVLLSITRLDSNQIVLAATDITERLQARRELEQRERQFRQMAHNFDEVFWIFDGNWTELIYLDETKFEQLYGLSAKKLKDDPHVFLEALHPEDRRQTNEAVENLKQGKKVELEYRVNPEENYERWVWVEGVPILNENKEVTRIIGASREITERKQLELQLEYGATHDLQTGLLNHSQFKEKLNHNLERASRYDEKLAVTLLDIDHFKEINDEHGHLKGDEILEEIAAILQEVTRESDLTARYGGEEFGLILPQSDLEEARQLAERIRKEIAATKLGGLSQTITVSGGVSSRAGKQISADVLLNQADEALYTAKIQGRNRVESYSKQEADTDAS